MELQEVLQKRRSIRHFLNTPVSHEIIGELLRAARRAPVSCNLQLTKFIVVDDSELLSELRKKVSYKFKYAPTTIVAVYDGRYTVERGSALTTLGMEVENILLRAVDLGLGTCPMAGFKKDDIIRRVLKIPSYYEIGLLIAVGYPDTSVYTSDIAKISDDEILSYNEFAGSSIPPAQQLALHTPSTITDYRSRIGSVYLDRGRLNTWSDSYYGRAVDIFKRWSADLGVSKLIDIMTYDGKFLQLLSTSAQESYDITASDYVPSHLVIYKALWNVHAVGITSQNAVAVASGQYDIATFVFQSSFTPSLEKILAETHRILRSGGYLFIAHGRESFLKRWLYRYRRLILRLRGKQVNIYENNPYYKVGAYAMFPFSTIEKELRPFFSLVKKTATDDGRLAQTYSLFRKL